MLQLYYLQIEGKFTARNKMILSFFFNLAKVAAKCQLLTLLSRKSEGENKFATSVDIVVAKGKILCFKPCSTNFEIMPCGCFHRRHLRIEIDSNQSNKPYANFRLVGSHAIYSFVSQTILEKQNYGYE